MSSTKQSAKSKTVLIVEKDDVKYKGSDDMTEEEKKELQGGTTVTFLPLGDFRDNEILLKKLPLSKKNYRKLAKKYII